MREEEGREGRRGGTLGGVGRDAVWERGERKKAMRRRATYNKE